MKFLFVSYTVLLGTLASACSCEFREMFPELSKEENSLVVIGTVVAHMDYMNESTNYESTKKFLRWIYDTDDNLIEGAKSHLKTQAESMVLVVTQVLKGDFEGRLIKVWGDSGMKCRPYVEDFVIGKTYAMIIFPSGVNEVYKDPDEEYFISGCGEFWLKEENGLFITDKSRWIPDGKPLTVLTHEELEALFEPVAGGDATR